MFQVNAKRVDFSGNSMSEPSFEFYDQSLLDEVVRGEPDTQEFFRLLSVCHTGLVTKLDSTILRAFHRLCRVSIQQ